LDRHFFFDNAPLFVLGGGFAVPLNNIYFFDQDPALFAVDIQYLPDFALVLAGKDFNLVFFFYVSLIGHHT
jgi:hypothetical protein